MFLGNEMVEEQMEQIKTEFVGFAGKKKKKREKNRNPITFLFSIKLPMTFYLLFNIFCPQICLI